MSRGGLFPEVPMSYMSGFTGCGACLSVHNESPRGWLTLQRKRFLERVALDAEGHDVSQH